MTTKTSIPFQQLARRALLCSPSSLGPVKTSRSSIQSVFLISLIHSTSIQSMPYWHNTRYQRYGSSQSVEIILQCGKKNTHSSVAGLAHFIDVILFSLTKSFTKGNIFMLYFVDREIRLQKLRRLWKYSLVKQHSVKTCLFKIHCDFCDMTVWSLP